MPFGSRSAEWKLGDGHDGGWETGGRFHLGEDEARPSEASVIMFLGDDQRVKVLFAYDGKRVVNVGEVFRMHYAGH